MWLRENTAVMLDRNFPSTLVEMKVRIVVAGGVDGGCVFGYVCNGVNVNVCVCVVCVCFLSELHWTLCVCVCVCVCACLSVLGGS